MAKIVKCRDCGKDVSVAAKACPHCGATTPARRRNPAVLLFWGVVGLLALIWLGARQEPPRQAPGAPQIGTLTGEAPSGRISTANAPPGDPILPAGVSPPSPNAQVPGGTGNEWDRKLQGLDEQGRRKAFTAVMHDFDNCGEVTRTFRQGYSEADQTAIWNVTCKRGESYGVSIKPDSSTNVLECSMMRALLGTDCFRKLDDPSQSGKGLLTSPPVTVPEANRAAAKVTDKQLRTMNEQKRRETFGLMLVCDVTKTFRQAYSEKSKTAIWNVACSDGASWVVTINPDPTKNRVMPCSVMKDTQGVDCFKKLPAR